MTVKAFEELQIWKHARKLTNRIYAATKGPTFSKDFGLCDQIRRASVSVMSNIAEGYERDGSQELLQFLSIAKASCGEVRSQLYIVLDQGYADRKECEGLIDEFRKLSVMISNFIKYLKTAPFKGTKYKMPRQKTVKEELEEIMNQIADTGSTT